MRLIIRDDAATASKYVADYIIDRINSFSPTPQCPFILGLPTGSSPIEIYKHLITAYNEARISFKNIITFNMDEYVGLPPSHPESYHTFMFTHLFAHIDIPPSNVHILNGTAPDLNAECARFESLIAEHGGIHLFLAGLGGDGHLAFNEPGSSLSSRTRVKTLAASTIAANARFFGGDMSKVPRMALTVGIQTVMEAREVVVIVLGAEKAVALERCVEAGVSHMWTGSVVQMHRRCMVVADEEATGELRCKTVSYFKGIEKIMEEEGWDATANFIDEQASLSQDKDWKVPETQSEQVNGTRNVFEHPLSPPDSANSSPSTTKPFFKLPSLPRGPVGLRGGGVKNSDDKPSSEHDTKLTPSTPNIVLDDERLDLQDKDIETPSHNLAIPRPSRSGASTPDLQFDSMHTRLPSSQPTQDHLSAPEPMYQSRSGASTPDLVLDSMHTRVPEESESGRLGLPKGGGSGRSTPDLQFDSMHTRVPADIELGSTLAVPDTSKSGASTPDLVNDAMHDRVKVGQQAV